MGLKSLVIRSYSRYIRNKVKRDIVHAQEDQERIFQHLIKKSRETKFGKDHAFSDIRTYEDFTHHVPVRDYEALKSYFNLTYAGKKDILWPGKPTYLAKTSGTTSGVKYIPLTKDSIPNHFGTAKNAALNYAQVSGNYKYIEGKLIFLSGSPALEEKNGIKIGRLSGISNHLIPAFFKRSQLPSYNTNCIEDWEKKLEKVVLETASKDMRMISGIPPWVQMYFESLLSYTGKTYIKDIFPNFSLFVYGGVNYEPYRTKIESLIGERIDSIETYPASEGFIAFQDDPNDNGLLLNTNSGIFFEFVKAADFFDSEPQRYRLNEVEVGVNYVLIISSNAGLWGYNLGDTVIFKSKNPYKLSVSGRIKHYISAFGEHVIGSEVELSMQEATQDILAQVIEFTVAPEVTPSENQKPYHEWFISFAQAPDDMNKFAGILDNKLRKFNVYYDDLRKGNILGQLKITELENTAFRQYMKSIGKLGGQNKVPRLSNDRKIAEKLYKFKK